jgi:hypothetical protein
VREATPPRIWVDRVLPHAPYRQWVYSFPKRIRLLLARDPTLISAVLRAFLRVLFAWQRRRARKRGIRDGQCGAVTFIQRFGGFVNLNVHFHAILPDGVFTRREDGRVTLVALEAPTHEEVVSLTQRSRDVCSRSLDRYQQEQCFDDALAAGALTHEQAASIQQPLPSPNRVFGVAVAQERRHAKQTSTRSASIDGFSLRRTGHHKQQSIPKTAVTFIAPPSKTRRPLLVRHEIRANR